MKTLWQISLACAICCGLTLSFFAQQTAKIASPYVIANKNKFPQLAIDYSKSIAMKIATPKTEYRRGENLIVSYAVMNFNEFPVFVYNDPEPSIAIYNKDKKSVKLKKPLIVDYVTTAESFNLLKQYDFFYGNINLLIGCEDYLSYYSSRHSSDNKTIFEKNLFIQWADGCVDIDKESSILISITSINPFLVINKSKKQKQYPTAVGEIKSNVLELKIIN